MSGERGEQREREVDFKCHVFKAKWSIDYFVIQLDGKALCLTCSSNTVAVLKKYYIYTGITKRSTHHNILNS